MLLLLLLLPACARPVAVADTPRTAGYVSEIETPKVKALYQFGLARLAMDDNNWQLAVDALNRAIAQDPEAAYLHLSLAEALLAMEQQEDAARQVLERALQLEPDLLQAHLMLAQLLLDRGDNAAALPHLQRAAELKPDDDQLLLQLAVAHGRAGRPDEMEQLLRKRLEQQPDSVAILFALGRLYRQTGRPAEAEPLYRRALELRPELQPVVLELSALLAEGGRLTAALELLEAAARRNPAAAAYRHQMVQLLVRAKRLDEARGELETLLTQNPEDDDARRKLGLLHLEQRNWVGAEAVLRPLIESGAADDEVAFYFASALEQLDRAEEALPHFAAIGPDSSLYPDAAAHHSMLLRSLDRPAEAVAVLNAALAHGVKRMEFYLYLAGILRELKQGDAALQVLERGAQNFPTNTRFPYQIGMLRDEAGDKDGAIASMQQVLALDSNHADALNYLAYSWAERGENLEQALAYIQQALERKRPAYMLDTLGWVYYKLGRLAEAREALEQAVPQLPEDLLVLEHLADVYQALGLRDKASKAYRQILETKPGNDGVRRKLEELERR